MTDSSDPPIQLHPPTIVGQVGGVVDASRATPCIYHENLDSEYLTVRLGVKPTRTRPRGDKARPESRPLPFGVWLFEVHGEAPRGPDDVLQELLMRLSVEPEVWRNIVETHQVRIVLGLDMLAWNRGFAISPALLEQLAQLGVELDFDIYANYEEDGP